MGFNTDRRSVITISSSDGRLPNRDLRRRGGRSSASASVTSEGGRRQSFVDSPCPLSRSMTSRCRGRPSTRSSAVCRTSEILVTFILFRFYSRMFWHGTAWLCQTCRRLFIRCVPTFQTVYTIKEERIGADWVIPECATVRQRHRV